MPQSTLTWGLLFALSLGTTAAILFIFVRIGPFRTAVIMHLEPLSATVLSTAVLGDIITPVQAIGIAIMLSALIAFQVWR